MVESPAWLKLAMELDGRGGARPFDPVCRLPETGATLWISLDYSLIETRNWLAAQPEIPESVADALVAEDTRPRTTRVGEGLLICLRGVNLYPDARPEDLIAVRLWIRDGLIISSHKRPLLALSEIGDQLLAGKGPVDAWQMLAWLTDILTRRFEDVVERIEVRLDEYSELLETSPDRALTHAISSVRRRTITLRRYLAPQREAISRLQAAARLAPDDGERVQETGERLQRLVETLDAIRDQATLLQEEVFAIQNEVTNDRMYLLAAITAVFLPLTFLTGLFGINVGGMPGADDPHAFWWFVGALTVMALLVLLRMIHLHWFGDRAAKAVRLGRRQGALKKPANNRPPKPDSDTK